MDRGDTEAEQRRCQAGLLFAAGLFHSSSELSAHDVSSLEIKEIIEDLEICVQIT